MELICIRRCWGGEARADVGQRRRSAHHSARKFQRANDPLRGKVCPVKDTTDAGICTCAQVQLLNKLTEEEKELFKKLAALRRKNNLMKSKNCH